MSTKEEVQQAIDETGGPVWCFVKDTESPLRVELVCNVDYDETTDHAFDTKEDCYEEAELLPANVVASLKEAGFVKEQDSPLIKALKEGKKVVCYVSDDEEPKSMTMVEVLCAYQEGEVYPFESTSGEVWKYAKIFPKSELTFLD